MATGSYLQVRVKCPFYVTDDGKHDLICEGITDENKLVLRFTRKPYLVAYVRRFCADCFTDCWINQLLMTKYNEEHETNE